MEEPSFGSPDFLSEFAGVCAGNLIMDEEYDVIVLGTGLKVCTGKPYLSILYRPTSEGDCIRPHHSSVGSRKHGWAILTASQFQIALWPLWKITIESG